MLTSIDLSPALHPSCSRRSRQLRARESNGLVLAKGGHFAPDVDCARGAAARTSGLALLPPLYPLAVSTVQPAHRIPNPHWQLSSDDRKLMPQPRMSFMSEGQITDTAMTRRSAMTGAARRR